MDKKKVSILGLSPGTKSIGIAIVKNGKLEQWRIKTFKGSWSKNKSKTIIRFIRKLVEINQITVIALKIHHPSRGSKSINEVIEGVKLISKGNNISVHHYSIKELYRFSNEIKRGSKVALMQSLTELYPELAREYNKEHENRNPYYAKMFEAIACALRSKSNDNLP